MSQPVVWKHIGLHGHSVGSFVCDDGKIYWKSAVTGRDDDLSAATSKSFPADKLANKAYWTVFGSTAHLRLQCKPNSNLKHEYRLDGFPPTDFETLKSTLKEKYSVDLIAYALSAAGTQYGLTKVSGKKLTFQHCVLDEMNEEGQEFEPRAEEELLSIDLAEVSQCVLPGNNRNEIEVQFPESDAVEAGTDQLVAIRMYIPPDLEADPSDKAAPTPAELLQQRIMQSANIRKTTGDIICSFDQDKGTFLTPRGRYSIELYANFLRLRGQKYDYKIRYDDINRLFLLPKPDELHMAFVVALDKPIRQGQQRYQCLVLQATKDQDEVNINLDEDTLQNEYGGEIQPVMRGALSNLVAKTFKVIAKKKVLIPGKFANANQHACVKCAVRASEGLLYPLEKQLVFIHKPTILVRFNEVESVEFQRYAGGQGSTRNFDLQVNLKQSVAGGIKDYTFSGIDRTDYAGLYNFLSSKKISIQNLQSMEEPVVARTGPPVYNEEEIYGPDAGAMEEESDDEDFDENAAAEAEQGAAGSDSDGSLDDEDLGSEVDDDLDSDLEAAKNSASKKKKKKSAESDDDDDDDDEDEESEAPKAKKRKKKAGDDNEGGATKSKKTKKDKNAPKRATSAYLYFSTATRDEMKEENPDVSFGELNKLLGAKWKTLSKDEKAKYEKMAVKDKERYQSEMKGYTPPASSGKATAAKKKKDPNKPKGASTSFLFYSNVTRKKLKEENPEMSFSELGKKVGEMFKSLSASEKEKYEDMARKDKLRYKNEMAAYNAKGAAAPEPVKDDSDSDGLSDAGDDSDDDSE